MRFLSLKLDSRFLTCQGLVEELEGHTLNSPTVIYAFIYGKVRVPSWLFLGSKRETVDLFKNRRWKNRCTDQGWISLPYQNHQFICYAKLLDVFFSCNFQHPWRLFYPVHKHSQKLGFTKLNICITVTRWWLSNQQKVNVWYYVYVRNLEIKFVMTFFFFFNK